MYNIVKNVGKSAGSKLEKNRPHLLKRSYIRAFNGIFGFDPLTPIGGRGVRRKVPELTVLVCKFPKNVVIFVNSFKLKATLGNILFKTLF